MTTPWRTLRGAAAAPAAPEPGPTDAELVHRAVAGDARAFDALVRRHLQAAYAVARAIVVEPADAEDVCQDAFTAVLARLEECQPAEKFRAWLLRSVRNRAISFRRWQRVRAAAVLGTGPGEFDLPTTLESPLAAAERADLRARLTDALATLSDAQRTVVLLHDVEGWGHREIAAVLGVAEGTSRATLFAARRRLRAELGETLDRVPLRRAG
jgi:RNA polymerase sigma-70 factor, ECF subfamily